MSIRPIWPIRASKWQEFLNLYILIDSTLTNSGTAGRPPHGPYTRMYLYIAAVSGQLLLDFLVSRLGGLNATQVMEERKCKPEAMEVLATGEPGCQSS